MIRRPHQGDCAVRLRRRGRRRHRVFVADGDISRWSGRWSDAWVFANEGQARLEAVEQLRCMDGVFDSAQIVDARSRRVLSRVWIERAPS